jgi:hypothetical protein
MLKTLEAKRTEKGKALSLTENGVEAQSLGNGQAGIVYCPTHGLVKGWHNECELCVDAGWLDFDATRVAKELIPSWVGINPDGRQVIVARVRDALDAVEKIGQYKNSDAIVLLVWDTLVTALDNGRIGPSWTVQSLNAVTESADEILEVECAHCAQPFEPVYGNEQVCNSCWLAENGPPLS